MRSYPKGLGILKEFIQNADDAEADEIVFVIDEQHYSVVGLPESMYWLHNTPALLIYNNKPFSERDIDGIQKIGESGKSESVGKTGRFGLGFNSCYNVTDVPCFLTRGALHFFDPHVETLLQASAEHPGRRFGVDELLSEGCSLLDAFCQFSVDGSEFDGTVFRLPFRTAPQATTSKIKKDIYTVSDALDAVRELQEMGSAILIFLKHVKRLKVEHRNRDGSVVDLLNIQAINPQEIFDSRAKVNDLLCCSDPELILTELSELGQVYSSCRHEYSVIIDGVEKIEKWRVVNGFFTDEGTQVVDACRKMIQNEEKALPYAGAAWPIDFERLVNGRIFCFLPVPIQTNIPIQINGYFDLDDSRQNMFLDPSAHGKDSHRVQWNKALLECSVVKAYIRLLEDLRLDLGNSLMDIYYRTFPNAVVDDVSWEGWLTVAFYKYALESALFKISGDTPWSLLSATRSLPNELFPVGDVLIGENCLPIPHPSLPAHIRNGFLNNGINLPMLTPNDLRIRLKELRDVDCLVDAAPRKCLQKAGYIELILHFCLSDIHDIEDIRGLPLVIDRRGHIRTIGMTESPLYLIEQPWDVEVFKDHPEWFIESKLAMYLEPVKSDKIKIVKMDSSCFVKVLSLYTSALKENDKLKMSTENAGVLTDNWLQAVFNRLIVSDLDKLADVIRTIPLIPDQSRDLHPMGYTSTPLLFQGTKENLELKQALNTLNVPIVSNVSSKLFNLLIDFSKKKNYLWRVTPCDLVDTLVASCSELIRNYDYISDIQRAILDFLSSEASLEELRRNPNQKDKLKSLKIFPTSRGDLFDLNTTAYVSQNFIFPSCNFNEVMLDCGDLQKWRNLYLQLGARELSRSRLIRELLLPGYMHLDAIARVKASIWLRDNLSIAQSEDETDDSDGLFEEVRNTPFIICEDGVLRAPTCVYQPDSLLASAVLGAQAAFPDMEKTYANNRKRWLEFFRQLNMATEPRLTDVLQYVHKLIEETSYDFKVDRLQTVYEFIKGRIEADIQHKVDVSDELSEVLKELSGIPWIPVRQEAGNLLCFRPAEATFACPGDVYFPRVGQLVASQANITVLKHEPNKLTRQAMGFPVITPILLVVNHFVAVLTACKDLDTMPDESVLVKLLGQIYRFFGGEVPREIDEIDEENGNQNADNTMDIGTIFSKVPCLWDQEKKCFWRPDHVFSDNVRYMEPWRRTIRNSDVIERGYIALGRRDHPTLEDWKNVLEEISQSSKSLPQNELDEVIHEVVHHIVKELVNREDEDGEVLVPTRKGLMLPARTVYMADAPWFESMIDTWDIPILSPIVSSIFAINHVLKIPSLADSIKQYLVEFPSESDWDEECQLCSRLENLLKSKEFIIGFNRLFHNEGHRISEKSLSFLYHIQIRCVKTIHTCLYLQFDNTERLLGDALAEFYWDQESLQAMLVETRYRYFCNDLAEMLNRTMGDILRNLAPLVHILLCDASDISEALDDLKIRKYSFDLDEEIDDGCEVAPQEFPDDENEGMNQDIVAKSEVVSGLVSDSNEHVKDNETEENGFGSKMDNSGEVGENIQRNPGSTATIPKREEIGQSEDNSTVDRLGSSSGSVIPSGNRSTDFIHRSEERSDFENGQSIDEIVGAGKQLTTSNLQHAAQRRMISYVSHGNSDRDENNTPHSDDSRRLRIGDAAVEIVIDHEKKNGRKVISMAHNNPGYDIISECDGVTRYIEVKGIEAAWGERGVAVSSTQFFYERENPDREFWLYVVEDVFSHKPQIHKILSPSRKVDYFVFDGGWRQAAESSEEKGIEISIPSPGDEVLRDGNVIGIIESITKAGKFQLVTYRSIDGSQQRKLLTDIIFRSKEVE